MVSRIEQAIVLTGVSTQSRLKRTTRLALFNENGTPYVPGGITTTQAVAAVAAKSQIVAVTPSASANGVAAAGANPTKAEYDVVVALVNELKTKFNSLLAALKA